MPCHKKFFGKEKNLMERKNKYKSDSSPGCSVVNPVFTLVARSLPPSHSQLITQPGCEGSRNITKSPCDRLVATASCHACPKSREGKQLDGLALHIEADAATEQRNNLISSHGRRQNEKDKGEGKWMAAGGGQASSIFPIIEPNRDWFMDISFFSRLAPFIWNLEAAGSTQTKLGNLLLKAASGWPQCQFWQTQSLLTPPSPVFFLCLC